VRQAAILPSPNKTREASPLSNDSNPRSNAGRKAFLNPRFLGQILGSMGKNVEESFPNGLIRGEEHVGFDQAEG
jgi:hypothetical protein